MQSRQLKIIFFITFFLPFFNFSCDHSSIDPESAIKNATDQEVEVKIYDEGVLFYEGKIQADGSRYYCTCEPINLNADSTIFKLALGDSIVYHNQQVANSNFEQTKGRSPFVSETWNELSENIFQYTILPGDFK